MENTQKIRAKKGGELGINGMWYEGGQFLPSTQLPKMDRKKKRAAKKFMGKKQQIAPFVWELPPAMNTKSIYSQVENFATGGKNGSDLVFSANDQTIAYYNLDVEKIQNLIDRYNDGERWTAYDGYWWLK